MYIMCVSLFSALSRRVGALQMSIIIIIEHSITSVFFSRFFLFLFFFAFKLLHKYIYALPQIIIVRLYSFSD